MSEKRMDLFAELVEQHKQGLLDVDIWQRKPYTAVSIAVEGRIEKGFSKVCYPDVWDAEEGILRAVKQALRHLVPTLVQK